MELVESGKQKANDDVLALMPIIREAFETEPIYTDTEQLDRYLSLQKYFPYMLLPWEIFILALCSTCSTTGPE